MTYSETDLRQLRRLVSEAGNDSGYSDDDLTAILDNNDGSMYRAAAQICREKAAAATALFDFSADGGSYQRGDIAAKWLKMAETYGALAGKRSGGTINLVKWPPEMQVENVLNQRTSADA